LKLRQSAGRPGSRAPWLPSGDKLGPSDWLSAVALVLTALVPIVASWESFFDDRWMWVRYTAALNSLYGISDELEFALTEPVLPDADAVRKLYDRLQSTLQDADKDWSSKRVKDRADDAAQGKASK